MTEKEYQHQWYLRNKVLSLNRKRAYRKKNKQATFEYERKYCLNKRHTDPVFKIKRNLRKRLTSALKNNQKRGSAVRDVGCTIGFLKQYLSTKFYGNMSWSNYGTYWQIDHIIPLKNFDLADRNQFLKAVHYTNLQPLTVEDHRNKTSKDK
jgi:5-methylcytosine-specific restriction endonuclease McrA